MRGAGSGRQESIRGEEVLAAATVGALISERKEENMSDINARIKSEIDSADVVLFMKGTPQAPQCGFSMQVVQILNHLGAPYKAINVLADGEIREGIKAFSNWPTIPQLYVKQEFLGGCDITREMFQSGELTALFDKEGIPHKAPAKA